MLPAVPIADTVKRAASCELPAASEESRGGAGFPAHSKLEARSSKLDVVAATVDRAGLHAAQTPQTFRRGLLSEAYARARADGVSGTDDAGRES